MGLASFFLLVAVPSLALFLNMERDQPCRHTHDVPLVRLNLNIQVKVKKYFIEIKIVSRDDVSEKNAETRIL